jgi:hypothetical protein
MLYVNTWESESRIKSLGCKVFYTRNLTVNLHTHGKDLEDDNIVHSVNSKNA